MGFLTSDGAAKRSRHETDEESDRCAGRTTDKEAKCGPSSSAANAAGYATSRRRDRFSGYRGKTQRWVVIRFLGFVVHNTLPFRPNDNGNPAAAKNL